MNRNSVIIRVADTYHKLAEVWYIISKISSGEDIFLITAFAKLENGKISRLDEYYSECGPAPQWRQEMKIGKPIKV